MIKLIGIILIIISAAVFGNFKSNELKQRYKAILGTKELALDIERKTKFYQMSLTEILTLNEIAEKYQNLDYIKAFHENIETMLQPEAITKAVKDSTVIHHKADKEMLIHFFSSLGRTDMQSEMKKISIFAENISTACERTKNEYEKSGTLYRKLSVLGGLIIGVFLI